MSCNPIANALQHSIVPHDLAPIFPLPAMNRLRQSSDDTPVKGSDIVNSAATTTSTVLAKNDDDEEEDGDYAPSESGSDESFIDDTDIESDGESGVEDESVLFVGGPIHPMVNEAGLRVEPGDYIPPSTPVPTAYGFVETVGPFIAGTAYGIVPDYMRFNPYLEGEEYFVIARGRFIGVVTCPILAEAAVSDCIGPLCAKSTNQTAAVNKFNNLLAMGLVSVA